MRTTAAVSAVSFVLLVGGAGAALASAAPPTRSAAGSARTTITCWAYPKQGKPRRLVVEHPRNCLTLSPKQSNAEGSDLRRLRWRHWGSAQATATGFSRALHGNRVDGHLVFPETRVTVRAVHRVTVDGHQAYRTLELKTRFGSGPIQLEVG